MKEFIEKLIERIMLESASCKVYKLINPNKEDIAEFNAYKKCIEIVKELAEEQKEKLQPQIVEILEGDLLIIKTDLLLHPEHLYKIRQNVKEQKESGIIVLDARFDYTIVKMNKEETNNYENNKTYTN